MDPTREWTIWTSFLESWKSREESPSSLSSVVLDILKDRAEDFLLHNECNGGLRVHVEVY